MNLLPQALARFTSVDPKRQYQNPYSYVGNNPMMRIDLDGQLDTTFIKNFPIEVKLARIAETFGRNNKQVQSVLKRLGRPALQSRILENLTPGRGATLKANLQILNARASYKNRIISVFPLDKNKKVTLASLTRETVTLLHEITHDVAGDEPGMTVYRDISMLAVRRGELVRRTSKEDLGTVLESKLFGFNVTLDSVEFFIENRNEFENDERFKLFFDLVDFVAEETGLRPSDMMDTRELQKRLLKESAPE